MKIGDLVRVIPGARSLNATGGRRKYGTLIPDRGVGIVTAVRGDHIGVRFRVNRARQAYVFRSDILSIVMEKAK